MPKRKYVKLTKEGQIAIITIDHPPVNALDTATLIGLGKLLDEVKKDNTLEVIIITAAGKLAFSAGADIKEIAQSKSAAEVEKIVSRARAIINKVEKLGKPIICAINGVCLGGGNELAMAGDIRIASDKARFGQPEVNLGIIPGLGGTQRLPRLVGVAKAKELIFTGEIITSPEAWRIGLVNKVVPEEELLKEAKNLAKQISAK